MQDNSRYLDAMKALGLADAASLQHNADGMSGAELYEAAEAIPDFSAAKQVKNMLDRLPGFVCQSTAGRVVRLVQGYDSDIYPQEPEELPAQWGFVWSQEPGDALPFLALSTSPYNTGDCCLHEGHVWRSGQDGNVWAPGTTGVRWEDLGAF